MPVTVKDMVRKAEIFPSVVSRALKNHLPIARVSDERIQRLAREDEPAPIHRLGIMAHHVTDLFCNRIQGGLERVAYPLIIRASFLQLHMVINRGCICEQSPSITASLRS